MVEQVYFDVLAAGFAISILILAIVGFILARLKRNDTKIYSSLMYYVDWFKQTDYWVKENQERIATIVSVLENLFPKVKESLDAKNTDAKNILSDLEKVKAELDRFYEAVEIKKEKDKPTLGIEE